MLPRNFLMSVPVKCLRFKKQLSIHTLLGKQENVPTLNTHSTKITSQTRMIQSNSNTMSEKY